MAQQCGFKFYQNYTLLKRLFFFFFTFNCFGIVKNHCGLSPVLPVFPPPVRRRVVRNLALRLQTAVRVTRTRPDHRRLLYGRPALRLSPLHFAPLPLRLHQLIPVLPVLVLLARRRLPTPVPVPPVRFARPSGLLALVVGRPSAAVPVSNIKQ